MAHTRTEFQTLRQNYLTASDELRSYFQSVIAAMNNAEIPVRIVGDMAPMKPDLAGLSEPDAAELSRLTNRIKAVVNGKAA